MANINFIVSKINNVDVNCMPKKEVLQMFFNSDEPLLLEVRRKNSFNLCDIRQEIEDLHLYGDDKNIDAYVEPSENIILSMTNTERKFQEKLTSFSQSTQTEESFDYSWKRNIKNLQVDKVVEEEHNIFEQCLEPEIDIEEITLRKSSSNEHLGLTVCYSPICGSNGGVVNNNIGSKQEQCADVYISEIQPESVACKDGRLRTGDQILQINGKDIKSKEDTEALIAENNNAVTFLVSRYLYTDDDYFNDPCSVFETNAENEIDDYGDHTRPNAFEYKAYEESFREKKALKLFTNETYSNKLDSINIITDSNGENEINACLTSGNGCVNSHIIEDFGNNSSDKTKNPSDKIETEHIYETIPEYSDNEPFYSSPYEITAYSENIFYKSSSALEESNKSPAQKQRVAQWLGIRNHISGRPNHRMKEGFIKTENRGNVNSCANDSHNTIPYNSSGTKYINDDMDNSSSAYNSGGSNNSVVPSVQILGKQPHLQVSEIGRAPIKDTIALQKSKEIIHTKVPTIPKCQHITNNSKCLNTDLAKLNNTILRNAVYIDSNTTPRSDSQNFTAPNLSQYHFVSSQEVSSTLNSPVMQDPLLTPADKCQEQMVWKVKRRADGSRYIVRRPVRKYLIKDRTFRLNGLKCDPTTTEDDTVSEVKLGRYWSKEDRKKHIERAKEKRQNSRNHDTSISKPSLRKGSRTNCKNVADRNVRNITPLAEPKYESTEQMFFKLQFNSNALLSEKSIKNKDSLKHTTELHSIHLSRNVDLNCDTILPENLMEERKSNTLSTMSN